MVSPPPPRDQPERSTPLLPSSGVDAESVFDLPYAVDDRPLPPPPASQPPPPSPGPAWPPTFSAPGRVATATPPPPASAARSTRSSRSATGAGSASSAPLPAPLDAGHLAGHEAYEEDLFSDIEPAVPLPPMVAKGDWTDGEDPRPAAAGSNASPTVSPGGGSSRPSFTTPPPPMPPAPPPSAPRSSGTHQANGSPTFATIQPLTLGPDPRQLRGQPVIVSETRIGDGLLVAAAAAAVAGVLWWAVVALTQRQFVYVAVLLGMMVGQAGLVGGRKGSLGLGIVAASVTLLSLTATQYFITRSLAIAELGVDVPLWDGSATFIDVIRTTFREDPLTGVFVVGAAAIAGFVAGTPGRRASGPLGEVHVSRPPDRIL